VDAVFALHGWPEEEVGTIAVGHGPVHAASNPFEIVVRGKGAHGAYPHQGVDPIVAAAGIVTALQTVVSRTVDPLDTAVVTVGQIEGGSAINIIPETCRLTGTIRTLKPEVRRAAVQRVREVAENGAQAFGATADVDIVDGYPMTVNDESCVGLIKRVGREVLGSGRVRTLLRPSMGAEDFSYYAQRVPAAIFRLGIRPRGAASCAKLHSAHLDFNDDALPFGIMMLCRIAETFLSGT
jgi:amidohydrolase